MTTAADLELLGRLGARQVPAALALCRRQVDGGVHVRLLARVAAFPPGAVVRLRGEFAAALCRAGYAVTEHLS